MVRGPGARRLADRAIAIDPTLAEAHAVSGLIMGGEANTSNEEEIEVLEYALSLNPNLDNTRNWLSISYGEASRNDEATALLELQLLAISVNVVITRSPLSQRRQITSIRALHSCIYIWVT